LKIELTRQCIEELMKLAEEAKPIESCAILIGVVRGDVVKVVEICPAKNVDKSPTSFSVSPDDIYRAYRVAEEKDMEIVGIFHFHPAEPLPSGKDLDGMKKWPVVWLIMGLSGMRAFKLVNNHEVVEVELSVVNELDA